MNVLLRVYAVLIIIVYGIFLWRSFEFLEVWLMPSTWINWMANFIGLLALSSIAFRFDFFPRKIWIVALVLVLAVYGRQLIISPIFGESSSSMVIVTILVNHILFIIPPVLACAYKALRKKTLRNR